MCSATSRNAANTPPLYHHRSATTSSDEFLIWFRLACLCVCFVVALDVRREKNTSCRNREWRKRNPKRVKA
jgi:hypothetical protein